MKKDKKTTIMISIIIVVVIAILISLVFVFNNKNTKDYDNKLEEAQKYVEEMDYKNAELAYLDAINIDPKQAKAYIGLADVYEVSNQNEKVDKILNKAEEDVSSSYKKEITNRKKQTKNLVINNGGEHVTYNGKTYYWKYSDYSMLAARTGIFSTTYSSSIDYEDGMLICESQTGEQTILYKGKGLGNIWIVNERLFLVKRCDVDEMYNMNIFSIGLDGSNEILHENDGYIAGITNDKKLIMDVHSSIRLLDTKTLKKKTLCKNANFECSEDKTIYYHSYDDDKLVRINTNGKDKKVLASSTASGSVQLLDDCIYYLEEKSENKYICKRIKKDGSGCKKIKTLNDFEFVVLKNENKIEVKEGILPFRKYGSQNEVSKDKQNNLCIYVKGKKINVLSYDEYSSFYDESSINENICFWDYDVSNFYYSIYYGDSYIFYKKDLKANTVKELYQIKAK